MAKSPRRGPTMVGRAEAARYARRAASGGAFPSPQAKKASTLQVVSRLPPITV